MRVCKAAVKRILSLDEKWWDTLKVYFKPIDVLNSKWSTQVNQIICDIGNAQALCVMFASEEYYEKNVRLHEEL